MRIAMLIGALGRGGSERVMVNLAEYLIQQGHQVTMVTQYQKKQEYPLHPKAKRILSDITPKETTQSRMVNFLRRFRKLRRIWKSEKPDVILSFIGKNNLMALLTSRFLPVAVAVSVRGDPEEEYYTKWMRAAARFFFLLADGIILQTRRSLAFFPRRTRKKVILLKNLMDGKFFHSGYSAEREKIIAAVGRVDENKNHRMLIEAFSRMADEFPDYRVIIYGEGDLRETLQREVKEKGLESRIFLPGSVENVAEVICRCRVFVLTSDTEGVPNTLIEAMLSGAAVISTDCPSGGPAELILHQENGLLIPVGDIRGLEEHLRFLLSHPEGAEALGNKAADLQKEYDPCQVGKSWESYLESLIQKCTAAADRRR